MLECFARLFLCFSGIMRIANGVLALMAGKSEPDRAYTICEVVPPIGFIPGYVRQRHSLSILHATTTVRIKSLPSLILQLEYSRL